MDAVGELKLAKHAMKTLSAEDRPSRQDILPMVLPVFLPKLDVVAGGKN